MAEETLVTNIVAKSNFSDLIGDLNKVSTRLSALQTQLTSTNRALANQAAQMQKSFSTTLRSTGQFATHFVSLASDVEKFGKSLDSGQLKLGQYYGAWKEHSKTAGGLIRDLAKQQVMMQNAVLQPLGKNAQGLMQFNVHVPQGLDEIANKTKIASQELKIMNKVIQDGANQVINWGKNTQWAGRQLSMGLTLPIVAFGAAAQKAFLEADQQLVRLTKVYGGVAQTSAAELKKVRADVSATARELAAAYGASYKDTIALAADIAATGKQGNELLKSTAETTRLSILGEVDRQEAMKATLAIQTAFKQNTKELGESINFLNAVENQTSTSLSDLVEAIPKAGPVIQAMGGSIKDLALYMTAMKEGGISASEGANALKSAMASLVNPTKVAKEMFAGFGIDLGGIVTKNAGNLTGTILELQGALDKLNPLQKQQAIEQLFGKFQFARMNALFANLGKQGSQTLQVLDLMKASSKDLANIASREMTTMTESASGKYKRALESLKADMAGVGDQFLTVSTRILNVLDGVIKFFNNLPKPVKSVATFIAGLTAISGPLIMLTGLLANFFGYIAKGLFHFKAFLKGGEGFKLLTPEILAAEQAGTLMEKTFYSDAKASVVLKNAIKNLTAELSLLETKANSATVAIGPAIQTTAGAPIAAASEVIVNKSHPLVGQPYTRQMAHLIPKGMEQPGTIFGVVPNPGPVNQKISKNVQMYAGLNMPAVEGASLIRGVNTGIIPDEAAKWHAMTGALAMQSEAEIKALRAEVHRTGTVSASLLDSYQALLPEMTTLTQRAADESAIIVGELQAGKITVDTAKSRIAILNAEIETMMGQAATGIATAQGRTVNLTTVPLTKQPVVDPLGKSNMKELFHKGSTANFVDQLAGILGVRTSGAGYSRETTMPRVSVAKFLKRNQGGHVYDPRKHGAVVPGDTSINYDNTPASLPLNGFVLNQKASLDPNNQGLVAMAQGGVTGGTSNVPAIVTPGETVYTPEVLNANPGLRETLVRVNNGYAYGGNISRSKKGYGVPAFSRAITRFTPMSGARARIRFAEYPRFFYDTKTGKNETQQALAMLESHRLGRPILKANGTPYTEQELIEISAKPSNHSAEISRIWKGVDRSHVAASVAVQGSNNYITPGVMVPHLARGAGGNRTLNAPSNPLDIANSLQSTPIHPMAIISMAQKRLGYGSDTANLIKAYDELISSLKMRSQTFTPKTDNFESFAESILKPHLMSIENKSVASNLWKDMVSFGTLRGVDPRYGEKGARSLGAVGDIQYAPMNRLEQLTAKWPQKQSGYKMGRQYYLNNTDPLHGPLMIGRSMNLGQQNPDPYLLPRKVYYSDQFGRLSIDEQFLTGTQYDRGMYATSQYMSGNKSIMAMMENIPTTHPLGPIAAMKTLQKKFTGKLFRGVILGQTHNAVPDDIAKAIIEARQTGIYEGLIGKEFIMRRSSWSKDKSVASYFGLHNSKPEAVVFEALVKNRNILPSGDLFPKKTFQAPYGQDWGTSRFGNGYKSEQEAIFGGKFKIAGVNNGNIQLETVFEAREKGGNVNSGQPYIVGEKGPELFVPRNAGGIISNYALGGMIRASKNAYGLQDPGVPFNLFTEESARKGLRSGNPLTRANAQMWLMAYGKKSIPANGGVPVSKYDPSFVPGKTRGSGTGGAGFTDWQMRGTQVAGIKPMYQVPTITGMARSLYGDAKNIASESTLRAAARMQLAQMSAIDKLIKTQTKVSEVYYSTGVKIEKFQSQLRTDIFAPHGLISRTQNPATNLREMFSAKGLFGYMGRPLGPDGRPMATGRQGFLKAAGVNGGVRGFGANHPGAVTLAASVASTYAGQEISKKNSTLGSLVTTVGGILPWIAMGALQARGAKNAQFLAQATELSKNGGTIASHIKNLKQEAKIAEIAAKTGKETADVRKVVQAGRMGRVALQAGNMGKMALTGGGPIGWLLEGTLIAGQAAWVWKRHVEDVGKANRAVFGPTKKSLEEVGLKYVSINDKLKAYHKQLQLTRDAAASTFKDKNGNYVTGLTLNQSQVEAQVVAAKKNAKETVQDFNKTYGQKDVLALAASLKQQYISAGMSIQEATNKIYVMMKASNKGAYAMAAISSKAFKSITDSGTAADYAIKITTKAMSSGTAKSEELAVGINNVVNSLDQYRNSLVGTKDKAGNIIDENEALKLTLDKIKNIKTANTAIDAKTLENLKSQNIELAAILGKNETLASVYAKIALSQSPIATYVNPAGLSPEKAPIVASGLEGFMSTISKNISKKGSPFAGLGKLASDLNAKYQSLTKSANSFSTVSFDKIIKAQEEIIKGINKEYDARIKVLELQQKSEEFAISIKKEQLAYQNALASGDMIAAANAQLNIQGLIKANETEKAKQALQDQRDRKIEAAQAIIDQANKKKEAGQTAVSNAQIDATKALTSATAISAFQSTLTNIVAQYPVGKNPTKEQQNTLTDQLSKALSDLKKSGSAGETYVTDFLKKYSTSNSQIEYLKTLSSSSLKDAESSTVFGNAVKQFEAAVKAMPGSGNLGTSSNPNMISGDAVVSFGRKNYTLGKAAQSWSNFYDPIQGNDRQAIQKYTKQMGWSGGTYFTIPGEDGFNYKFRIKADGTIVRVTDPNHPGKAMGGVIQKYARGGSYSPGQGGYISGAGTPTSDSILLQTGSGGFIRASNKEYMHPASAVSYYGTHFMDLIRSRSIPKKWTDSLVGNPTPDPNTPMNYFTNKKFKGDGSSSLYVNDYIHPDMDYESFLTSKYGKNKSLAMAMGGAIPGYIWGGSILSMLKGGLRRSPRSAAAMASYSAGKEAEKYLSLRFGASEDASGIEKWGKAFARFGFDALNGGVSGAIAGGGAGFVGGSVAGTVEGLIGLLKSGSQFGVKGGTAYNPGTVKKRKDITWGTQNPYINADGGVYVDDLAKSDLSHMSLGKSLKNVLINGLIGAALPIPGDMLSQAAGTKAAIRQGVQVFDKRLPNFINNMMELGWLKPTQVLKDRNKILTSYQSIAAPADKIIPGKGTVNIYGPRGYAYKTAQGDEQSIFGRLNAFRNPYKKGLHYSAYVNSVDNNVVMPGYAPFVSGEQLLGMPIKGFKDILSRNKIMLQNKQQWWHSGSPDTLFHELGHRQLNLLGGPKIIAPNGQMFSTQTGQSLWSPLHEGYADIFHEKAYHIFKDSGLNKLNEKLGVGNTYVTNPGSSLYQDLFSHTNSAVNHDRAHQYGLDWLKAYGNTVKDFIPNQTYRRLVSMARVEKYKSPDDVLAMLQNKNYAIGGSISHINIPKFEDGINMVPADMLAMIHKNEAVVPANMNPFNPNANNGFGGERVYHIAPVINAAPGMDENAIADIATRKMLEQLKGIQYNEQRSMGVGRRI